MSGSNFFNQFGAGNQQQQQQPQYQGQQQQQQQQWQQQGGYPQQQQQQQPGPGQFFNNELVQKASVGFNLFNTVTGGAFSPENFDRYLPQESYIQKWVFTPFVRSFFDIDNMYVLQKLKAVFVPYLLRGEWAVSVNEFSAQAQEQNFLSPKDNIHSPDLYLPLMGLITFVLLSSLSAGIGENFHPEIIQLNTTYSLFITIAEIYLYKLLFYIVGIRNVGNLNMLSHLSYRFLSLTLIVCFEVTLGGWITFVIMIYLLVSSVFFIFKTLKRYIHTMSDSFGEMNFSELSQKNVLYLMSIIQLAVSYLLLKVTGV